MNGRTNLNKSAKAHTGFSDWTGGRTPASLSSNSGTIPVAFQNWRRVKEAFTPELVSRAVVETPESLGRYVNTCVDPFAGSGTTPLACQFLDVEPTAIELNPYLADLIEAKLTPIDPQLAAIRLGEVLDTSLIVDPTNFYSCGPPTLVEPGVKDRFLFSFDVAARLASLLQAIMRLKEEELRRLFRVLLGSAAIEVCNATVSGKGRRYRKNWHERLSIPADLDQRFVSRVKTAIRDLVRFDSSRLSTFNLIRGDAREELKKVEQSDLAIFSPPYPNSFDYTDVYNIELWVLGYLTSSIENLNLRYKTLRSHVQISRDMSSPPPPDIVENAIFKLREKADLWNRWIPDMIGAYFGDLRVIAEELQRILPSGGRAYVVLGDSRYSGIDIPVTQGLSELVLDLEFDIFKIEPLSSKRTSPQQGARKELTESLIILTRN